MLHNDCEKNQKQNKEIRMNILTCSARKPKVKS